MAVALKRVHFLKPSAVAVAVAGAAALGVAMAVAVVVAVAAAAVGGCGRTNGWHVHKKQ